MIFPLRSDVEVNAVYASAGCYEFGKLYALRCCNTETGYAYCAWPHPPVAPGLGPFLCYFTPYALSVLWRIKASSSNDGNDTTGGHGAAAAARSLHLVRHLRQSGTPIKMRPAGFSHRQQTRSALSIAATAAAGRPTRCAGRRG